MFSSPKLFAVALLAVLAVGVGSFAFRQSDAPPEFRGQSAKSGRIPFDLAGQWTVQRVGNLPEVAQTGDPERDPLFKEDWNLTRVGDMLRWGDESRGLFVDLRSVDGGQVLVCYGRKTNGPTELSINMVSFGYMHASGNDGAGYMLLRTDGGEGLPPLEYHDD